MGGFCPKFLAVLCDDILNDTFRPIDESLNGKLFISNYESGRVYEYSHNNHPHFYVNQGNNLVLLLNKKAYPTREAWINTIKEKSF